MTSTGLGFVNIPLFTISEFNKGESTKKVYIKKWKRLKERLIWLIDTGKAKSVILITKKVKKRYKNQIEILINNEKLKV